MFLEHLRLAREFLRLTRELSSSEAAEEACVEFKEADIKMPELLRQQARLAGERDTGVQKDAAAADCSSQKYSTGAEEYLEAFKRIETR